MNATRTRAVEIADLMFCLSVLEHGTVSFYLTGISRSLTHELIRHRHFSYSQLSQRYVPEHDSRVVVPPGMEDDPELQAILTEAADASRGTYTELLARLEAKFADQPSAVLRRKQARQAARAATESGRPPSSATRYTGGACSSWTAVASSRWESSRP